MSIFNAIGGAIGGVASIIGQERANKANKRMAEYQNQQNLQQWNRQNQYNSPSQQMQRLKEAGINPNMAYAKGTINNTVSSSPRMERAEAKSVTQNMPQLGNFMNIAQIQQIKEQTEALRLANEQTRINMGKDEAPTNEDGQSTNLEYTTKFNQAVQSAEDALSAEQKRIWNEKNVTTKELENSILEVKSNLADVGINFNNDNPIVRALVTVLAKQGITLEDAIKAVINKLK